MNSHLTDEVKTSRVLNATAAGSTNAESSIVDMAGFSAIRFIACLGTLTSTQVTKLKVQQGDEAGGGDLADLDTTETAAMGDDDDNDMLITDVVRPTKRYVRCVVVRGTANAVIDSVIAEQYSPRNLPVTQSAEVIDAKKTVSPV